MVTNINVEVKNSSAMNQLTKADANIISFLKENPSVWSASALERMSFRNRNGTLANPKAISRRLQENAAEGGVLQVSYDTHGIAHYQIKQEHRKKEQHIEYILKNGVIFAKLSYV